MPTTHARITFKLAGKKTTEPLTHLNPLRFTYERLNEINVEKSINEALADDDDDGVINRLDEEEDTLRSSCEHKRPRIRFGRWWNTDLYDEKV